MKLWPWRCLSMSRHDPKIRLRHMLDAAEKAVEQIQGKEREVLDRD